MRVKVRWAIRSDYDEIVEIDDLCYPGKGVSQFGIEEYVDSRARVICVAERGSDIVGFTAYEYRRDWIRIDSICVHPGFWRLKVGTELAKRVLAKLEERSSRQYAEILASECRLGSQLFLRNRGFVCEGTDGTFYVFRHYSTRFKASHPWHYVNRVSFPFGGEHDACTDATTG